MTVNHVAQRRALTLAEAAERLRVTPQRVSQLLRSQIVTGPDVGPGRAAKNAPRVWESSLAREEARRRAASEQRASQRRSPGNVSKRGGGARSRSQGQSARAAVLAMKVGLDSAREALRDERRANQRLTRQLADAVAEIEAARTQADRLDEIADGYSEALTQLGIPDDPRALY